MTRFVLAAAFSVTGCVVDATLKAADSVPRAISEASRRHALSRWAGRYLFSECRPDAPGICWTYEILLDGSGTATVRADGADLAIHVASKAETEDGTLRLPFEYYVDGNPDDAFFHVPFAERKGFRAGELLATIGNDREGRWCFVFGSLRSPLGTRMICAR
jgi:hypothetical protein